MTSPLHKRTISIPRVDSTIEMAALNNEEVLEVRHSAIMTSPSVDNFGSDDDSSDDEDNIALLGPERQSRGRELLEKKDGSTWAQVKDIVIEVRGCFELFLLYSASEDAIFHNRPCLPSFSPLWGCFSLGSF